MIKNIFLTTVCLLVFAATGANAQGGRLITLGEALDKAAKENRQVRMAQMDEAKAAASRRQTEGMLLPQVAVSYSGMVTDNPLNAFGFLLQQRRVSQASFNPDLLNHPDAVQQFTAGVDVRVPILNLDLLYARKGARLMETMMHHQQQHAATQTEYAVYHAYTALQMAYRSAAILDSALTDVQAICRNVTNYYQEGLVQKSDVMNAEVQVRTVESALAKARNGVADASDQLKQVMGEQPGGDVYQVVPLRQEQSPAATVLSAPALRDDLLMLQAGVDASGMAVKGARASLLPRLNAFGTYQFNDRKLLGFDKGAYLAGVSLSWNVFDGNSTRARLRAAKAEQSRMQEAYQARLDASQAEILANGRKLEQLQAEIRRQDKSVEQSAEALRVVTNRHAEGLDSTTDLLASRATLLRHQLEQAQAVMDYNVTYYYRKMITKNTTE